jgi:flagellar hook-associated protein FlgK
MKLDIHVYVHSASEDGELKHTLAHLTLQGSKIMATLKDVQDALAQAATDATAEKAEVAAAIQVLTDKITALQAQIDAGTAVTSADLDALVTQINGIDAQVKDITVPVPVV